MDFNLAEIILKIAVLIPSIVLHEFSHAVAATALGDPTPRWERRLTLNPLAHFDPFGGLMMLIAVASGVGIGWARPVGVNPRNFRRPTRDMMLVALAGPVSNMLLALCFGLPLRFMLAGGVSRGVIGLFLWGTLINISLALFNLIPIPPLDGSRIVRFFLRGAAAEAYYRIERYGMLILFALIMVPGVFDTLIGVPGGYLFKLIVGIG